MEAELSLFVSGEVSPPHVPYWDKVSADPSFAEMRQVVCIEGERPPISRGWQNSKILLRCASLMQECWHAVPNIRLPILRIKKTLEEVFSEAVKEVDETVVLNPVMVVSDSHTLTDSGIHSRSQGGTFQCSPETPYNHAIANGNVRGPREVLALGRIMCWPSETKSSEEQLTSKSMEYKNTGAAITLSQPSFQEEQ